MAAEERVDDMITVVLRSKPSLLEARMASSKPGVRLVRPQSTCQLLRKQKESRKGNTKKRQSARRHASNPTEVLEHLQTPNTASSAFDDGMAGIQANAASCGEGTTTVVNNAQQVLLGAEP